MFQPSSLILDVHQYIKTVFTETTWPIELKFHIETRFAQMMNLGFTARPNLIPNVFILEKS